MNKRTALSLLFMLCVNFLNAQETGHSMLFDLVNGKRSYLKQTTEVSMFSDSPGVFTKKPDTLLSQRTTLKLDKAAALEMYSGKPQSISLKIPSHANNGYVLELIQQDINTADEFSIGTLEGNGIAEKVSTEQGLHYRGYVAGDPLSIASLSVFANGDVMVLFSNRDGNFNLGKITDTDSYILYNSRDMKAKLGFECGTSELPPGGVVNPVQQLLPQQPLSPTLLCKKVRLYWEADYKLYSNNFGSNLTNTANYITGLFNQVATMYQNEGILIELTDTYIWTTADPYTTNTSSNGLATFKSRWNALGDTFKADLAVLIDGAPTNNGGIAYLLINDLCNRYYAYGYANVYASYNTVPVYSWDVEVVTHEMGHLMGSNHTHWCGWNTGAGGTCGAIDDCYTTEASATCSSCAATTSTNPSAPAGFHGTVMSYCHLRSGIGIDLANGFGPLPQAAIRNTVNNALCPLYDNTWTGAASTAWENPVNWSCNAIPTATTDVTVPSGLTNYPVITSTAVCRRIKQQPNTTVLVKTGFSLKIFGVQ